MNRLLHAGAPYFALLLVGGGLVYAQTPAPPPSADKLQAAEAALEAGRYPEAEAVLKALASTDPKNVRVLYDLGFAQERNGEDVPAADSYTLAIAADGSAAEPRVALGLLDARSGRGEQATEQLRAAAALPSASPELQARALRALSRLEEQSEPERARVDLLAALKLTPETVDDTLLAAGLAERDGDFTAAEAAYRRVLSQQPDDAVAAVGLGHVLQQGGKTAEAEEVLSSALKAHPDDVPLVSQMVTCEASEGKTADALQLLRHLRAVDAGAASNPAVTRLLARLSALTGDLPAAETLYTSLVAASGQPDPSLLDDLGSVQVKRGEYAQAEETLRRAVSEREAFHDDTAWGEAAAHLAFAASKNGDPKGSLQALTARATVLPNSPTSLFLEAIAHDALHENKEAVRTYRAFLMLANGKFPDQEFQARHRLVALGSSR